MRYPVIILLALLCAACGSYSTNFPSIKPYKMDIQQGNVVTAKMMMQLRPGMSKSQVRFIMGTPLLVDSFHADRWDYFYQMRKEGKIIEQRRVILEFEGDALARVRGDVIPAGSDTSMPAEATKSEPKSIAKPKEKEKGWLDKLKFWGDDEETAKPQAKPTEQAKPAETAKPAEPAKPVAEPAQAAPVPEKAQAAEPATEEPAQAESLPPLVDPAMQPKPEGIAPQAAQPAVAPQPAAPQEAPVKPAAKAAPKAEVKPAANNAAAKPKAQPEAKAMTAPEPPSDLPPEDSPDFFEKMLEKIGF